MSKLFIYSKYLIFILLTFFCINFPDIDQSLLFILHHRSMVTHSIIVPAILWYFFKNNKNFTYFIIPLYMALAIHLSADLFPKSWSGYALIYFPIIKVSFFGDLGSFLWVLANIILACFFSGKILLKHKDTLSPKTISLITMAIGALYILGDNQNLFSFLVLCITLELFLYKSFLIKILNKFENPNSKENLLKELNDIPDKFLVANLVETAKKTIKITGTIIKKILIGLVKLTFLGLFIAILSFSIYSSIYIPHWCQKTYNEKLNNTDSLKSIKDKDLTNIKRKWLDRGCNSYKEKYEILYN